MKLVINAVFLSAVLALGTASGLAQPNKPPAGATSQQLFDWADDILDDIGSAAGARRIDDVLAELERAVTHNPNDAALQLMYGRALIVRDCALRGNNCSVRAKGHLTKAAELDPRLVRARALLAHDALNSGCLPCAKPHLDQGERLDPSNPYILEARGRFEQLSGWHDRAEALYLRALEGFSNPKKRWQSYNWLSDIYQNFDNYERAEWALQQAVKARPDGAWSHGNLGAFYIFARGDYEKAIPSLRKALAAMEYSKARTGLALSLYERWADAYLKGAEPKTVRRLLDEAVSNYPDKQSMALLAASYSGTGRATQALLASDQVPASIMEQPWQNGRTMLLMAARNENTKLALYLLSRGANPNARDQNGVSVLHYATARHDEALLQGLVAAKANFQQLMDSGDSALTLLVSRTADPRRIKVAKILIDNGVPVNYVPNGTASALQAATARRDAEMVRYLLTRGADAGMRNQIGLTAPGMAVEVNDPDTLKVFIEQKAGLDAKVQGRTLLQYAEQTGKPELARMLRESGQ